MQIPITDDFEMLCFEIEAKGFSETEWEQICPTDHFHLGSYAGSYNGEKNQFFFNYCDKGQDYQFHLGLKTILEITAGEKPAISGTQLH
ncbi:MAG: hypothetical protein HRU20_08485 [Pseudomonadales bacterium]|nr:hypothetical protein [Pseudomonadales bacterium]